ENIEDWENDKGKESGYVEKPPFETLPPKEGNEEKEKKKGTKKRKKRGNKKKEATAYPRVYEPSANRKTLLSPHGFLLFLRFLWPVSPVLLLQRTRAGGRSDGHLRSPRPEYWDARDWDFSNESEDDEPLTDGEEDLQFLVDGELEAPSDDDLFPWEGSFSSDEEEEEEEDADDSLEGYPPAKRLRMWWDDDDSDDEEEDEAPAEGYGSSDEEPAGAAPMRAPRMMMKAVMARRLGSTSVGLAVADWSTDPSFVLPFLSNRLLPYRLTILDDDSAVEALANREA
ncbi:hypothetical protein QYE76_037673, partial [Lolium multiflorum]